ncbi:hypothetical protein ERO13_D12G159600v2 [Gossypium hirsutum]|uniref:EXPERA domain-containing protein n=9 Tax=Gossypium TaxID=3633 RepID=A0A0D2RGW1_GOSRA|nr:uncharacterized protein LOC105764424 isoform X3 [Gossypium raimondii]XP_016736087.1 sigma intracellular receptor 2 [Gossypium hirsutum]KAB1999682.1 hypothetical protein ES319_D12G177900v1 [Gossypium barbadense]KAH1074307.1 hypothetical protein J1N35_026635 [Gossypium stocksii]MBA0621064.1 hypothetical protein [Gossypium davidsonii]MBA0656520.1 hypothetical protein [Gossypium klotzschianum]TYG41591.1 hypothetical protein ES288_D12G187900v1 [Gossypium darwinii]TYH39597.1 hypothetical protei
MENMGVLGKVVDYLLLLSFFSITLTAQLDIPESILPHAYNPFYQVYTTLTQDYLVLEQPAFFKALMTLELVYQLPLALLNIYGLLYSKPWFNTTCLLFGASIVASTTAMVGDILNSQKASANLMAMYYPPFLPLGVLAIVRGVVGQSSKAAPSIGNGPSSAVKKRA